MCSALAPIISPVKTGVLPSTGPFIFVSTQWSRLCLPGTLAPTVFPMKTRKIISHRIHAMNGLRNSKLGFLGESTSQIGFILHTVPQELVPVWVLSYCRRHFQSFFLYITGTYKLIKSIIGYPESWLFRWQNKLLQTSILSTALDLYLALIPYS